jgi:predicted metalloprotease with PDZ domain
MTKNEFPIQYDIALSSIAGHLFDISLHIVSPQPQGQSLCLPAWIPGSYMIRDFAKHVIKLTAFDCEGNSLNVSKSDKQTWLVEPIESPITIKYQVYAYDLSVRGAYINDQYGFFNGSNIFLEVQGQTSLPCALRIERAVHLFAHYHVVTTMSVLTDHSNTETDFFHAENYAELIDHPVLMGDYDCLAFKIADIDCELVFAGGHQSDMQRIVDDLSVVCAQHIALFGHPAPIERYVFITLLTDSAYGGLEHRASTALMYARNELPDFTDAGTPSEPYRNFLSLCSHEFFHTWHVKRIRPVELVNGSLAQECYTEQLWIYEGFTSYYDDLLVQRSKVISTENYLSVVAQNLTRLQRNLGRTKQSVTASSFDAWTKFYKQDESAINHIVSYYNKGAIIAMCLDLAIKLASNQQYSLDSVMQILWRNFGQTTIATPKTVIHDILKQDLQLDIKSYFDLDKALYSTEELPVEDLLKEFGVLVNYRAKTDLNDKGGNAATKVVKHDFGAQFKALNLGIEITQVAEQSSAYAAGILVGDIVVAIDSWQVNATNVLNMVDRSKENTPVRVSLFRDKRLLQVMLDVRPAPLDTVYLSIENSEKMQLWLTPTC